MTDVICPNCKELMSEKQDIGYDYKQFTYWQCMNCGHEKYD